jgi:hypothetical protein
MSGFLDIAKHNKCGYEFAIYRQGRSAGKIVQTYCSRCRQSFKTLAGQPKRDDVATRSPYDLQSKKEYPGE